MDYPQFFFLHSNDSTGKVENMKSADLYLYTSPNTMSPVFSLRGGIRQKWPPTLPSVPASLIDLVLRLYNKAVNLARFLTMSAGYSKTKRNPCVTNQNRLENYGLYSKAGKYSGWL